MDDEKDATYFEVVGIGSHYVFQYYNPNEGSPTQIGVNNGSIPTEFARQYSATELLKLI